MYSKADIYNLALNALLLTRQIIDPNTDKSAECAVLNTNWKMAFLTSLQEMNLDSTSETVPLELVATFINYDNSGVIDGTGNGQINPWQYAYKYPVNCANFRRIVSCVVKDTRSTAIDKKVAILNGQKVIYTNQELAMAEIIGNDVPITALNPAAVQAIAFKLAWLAAPLITGKGAKTLRDGIMEQYKVSVAIARAQDQDENFNYEDDATQSEFVLARMS